MKKKKIWILLGLLVVLTVCYFGIDRWSKAQEEKEAKASEVKSVPVDTLKDIADVSYQYQDKEFEFSKKDGVWQYVPDPDFPLEQSYVETMEDAFTSLKATRELKKPDALADYGLEKPAYTIQLKSTEGETLSVYIGNAAGDDYYMTLGDKTKVYTVGSTVLSVIQYDLNSLMANDSFPVIGTDNVKTVSIETKKDTAWETQKYNTEAETDQEKLEVIAGGLSAVKLTDCADYHVDGKEEKNYGLGEDSRTTVNVTYGSGDDENSVQFYIGGVDETGDNRYVQMEGSHIVYKVSQETIRQVLGEKSEAK